MQKIFIVTYRYGNGQYQITTVKAKDELSAAAKVEQYSHRIRVVDIIEKT